MTEAWEPRTEADIQDAIEQGLVRESHKFDAKREQPTPPGKNADIAIDLASFAIDGGRILYGLSQPRTPALPMKRAPFDISNLSERLDQVARGGWIDPPLRITCRPISSDERPGHGYLLVVIPASPDAPHQVDNKYRGRGDTTNIVLSDAEVRRLHEDRAARRTGLVDVLEHEVARDPTPPELRTQGHLFVIAQPLTRTPDLLARTFATAAEWTAWLSEPLRQRLLALSPAGGLQPNFNPGTPVSGRPEGYALHTYEIGGDRRIRANGVRPPEESELLDLEFHDDGGLRLFCGRASYDWPPRNVHVVFHKLIVTMTRDVVAAATAVSERADYLGGWGFGVAITGLGVAAVSESYLSGFTERAVEDYYQVDSVSYEDLRAAPEGVVKRLLTRFYRGIGSTAGVPDLSG